MYFDPKILKKFLITLFIIAGIFIGFQIVTDKDIEDIADESAVTPGAVEAGMDDVVNGTAKYDDVTDDQYGNTIQFANSFEHTKPGEYSEIIVEASGLEPGEFTIVYVRKAGTEEYIEAGGQEATADENGNISLRFMITQFGNYEVFLSSQGDTHVSPEIVVE